MMTCRNVPPFEHFTPSAMRALYPALAGLLIAFSSHSHAQAASQNPATTQNAPVEGGALIMPPAKELERARPADAPKPRQPEKNTSRKNVTPEEAARHGQQQVEPSHPKSLDDNCKGNAGLCKQDSAR